MSTWGIGMLNAKFKKYFCSVCSTELQHNLVVTKEIKKSHIKISDSIMPAIIQSLPNFDLVEK